MYLINTELTANWPIYAQIVNPIVEDLKILRYAPGCIVPNLLV